jgi:polyisoprenyl-phosphate glycosyltransferase
MSRSLAVVTPVFDDWDCLAALLPELRTTLSGADSLHIVIVNDGSTTVCDPEHLIDAAHGISSVTIVDIACNVGHQRAIAVGLSTLVDAEYEGQVLVIDSDGEDRPSQVVALLAAAVEYPGAVIVGRRRSRSEGLRFRSFYGLYKRLFRLLTGQPLDFGNLSLLPAESLNRITTMPELWNHFPATLMRSRLPLVKVDTDRSSRYFGVSKMNFVSLVSHGLAGVSAFIDVVFVRLLVLLGVLSGLFFSIGFVAVALRLFTSIEIPTWATALVALSLVGLLQALALLAILTFLLLGNRSIPSTPPRITARQFIRSQRQLVGVPLSER